MLVSKMPVETPEEPELMDMRAVCKFWGGTRPLAKPTIYRLMYEGRHPQPIRVRGSLRFLRSELIAERDRLIAERQPWRERPARRERRA